MSFYVWVFVYRIIESIITRLLKNAQEWVFICKFIVKVKGNFSNEILRLSLSFKYKNIIYIADIYLGFSNFFTCIIFYIEHVVVIEERTECVSHTTTISLTVSIDSMCVEWDFNCAGIH